MTHTFWQQVLGAVLGFAPSAVLIYWLGYTEGKNSR